MSKQTTDDGIAWPEKKGELYHNVSHDGGRTFAREAFRINGFLGAFDVRIHRPGIRKVVAARAGDARAEDERRAGEPAAGGAAEGEAKAYPVHILDHHEVVNDTLGGKPFGVFW